MWPLFAVRTAWIAVFFVGIGVFLLWFMLRVIGDLVTWFREEILDDYRQLRKTSQAGRKTNKEKEKGGPDTDHPA